MAYHVGPVEPIEAPKYAHFVKVTVQNIKDTILSSGAVSTV